MEQQTENWEERFNLLWGESPEGSPKHKRGEQIKEFIYQEAEKALKENDNKWKKILNIGKRMYDIGMRDGAREALRECRPKEKEKWRFSFNMEDLTAIGHNQCLDKLDENFKKFMG